MATKRITLGELENGMLIWNQGHLFTARNVYGGFSWVPATIEECV